MVMDGLFDSFGEETTVYRTKITFETMTMLANLTTKLTDFFYRYLDASNNNSYRIKPEQVYSIVNVT